MTDARLSELIDRAFHYRGYVTLLRRDGSSLSGYVFNRDDSHLDLLDETAARKLQISVDDIADISFTGEDVARKSQLIWERRKGSLEPRDTPPYGEWKESGPLVVVVALGRELKVVARALDATPHRGQVRTRMAGIDVVARAIGVGGGSRRVVQDESPRLLVSLGFSGALDATLDAGTLVLASAVRDENGDVLSAPEAQREMAAAVLRGTTFVEGELLCTTEPAVTPAEKRALARPGTLAVDMESYPAARAATEARTPWIALRAVVDTLDSSLPAFVREPEGRHVAGAIRHAFHGPAAVAELVRLGAAARRAEEALETGLRRLVPAIAAAEAHA
ncbi:MAG: hypothetical protein ACJ78V_20085 [Myxococcales bacterium]